MNSNDIVLGVTNNLVSNGITNKDMLFDYNSFLKHKKMVANSAWEVPSTTITPIMERLLFSIGQGIQGNVVCLGSYYGYAMLWLVLGNNNNAEYYGLDIDSLACKYAENNFKRLFKQTDNIHIECRNAVNYVEEFEDKSINILFIDVDSNGSKALYSLLIDKWYKKLKNGALILAHDPCIDKFAEDFNKYYKFTGDRRHFSKEIILPIDECGIHIARVEGDEYESN
ncbi:O-methyltransferase [Geomicrobium sp. JSM 1781026]|uniref:O-methyltransferase n=1 Tax=Geomicrobium sp. JSM 1781026 TaxID=3344580 RepID=UPI0035C0049A